jgi:glucokinase
VTKSIGMIVAGEIGPTETRLALCGLDVGRPVVVVEDLIPNEGFAGLIPIVQRFFGKYRPAQIRSAAFVVAGHVQDGLSQSASLPWPVEAGLVAAELGIDRVAVMSDVEAVAQATQSLLPEDLFVLSGGDADESGNQPGNQAVISAGAYPGISGLHWTGTEHRPFVSEGGHADFAPSNPEELRLALHLSAHVARVTVELLLSTAGLELIYRYMRGPDDEPAALSAAMRQEGVAAAIVSAASLGTDPVCRKAADMFLSIYGSAAGNLALTLRATGGVYLAGTIVPSLRGLLGGGGSGTFQSAFVRKAPMQALLGKIPVQAILNERAALLGAATVAARDLRTRRGSGWAS